MEQWKTTSLEVQIQKKYKSFYLDTEFTAKKGCLGILGPSGCGKSMTLKSIAGIIKPDQGKIVLGMEDACQLHEKRWLYDSEQKIYVRPQKRNVGYLFQNYALFPNMTVTENIRVGMKKSRTVRKSKQLEELMELFHISELGNRYPAQLSGGQQQRVALARIFAYEPEVLLLDEPFSAMDTYLREGLRLELLQILRRFDGISILVTHDRDEAYQMCDHLLLMDQGSVIESGETQTLFEHPKTVQAARLTGCKNISRIEKIGPHKVKAIDWNNLELVVAKPIKDDMTHIGIRAHDFQAMDANLSQEIPPNVIRINHPKIAEMPFEWYITLDNGIWWKREKSLYQTTENLPDYLYVNPESILLLKDKTDKS